MTKREEFKKVVIMALHPGMSYEGALNKEFRRIEHSVRQKCPTIMFENEVDFSNWVFSVGLAKEKPLITIGLVMQALFKKDDHFGLKAVDYREPHLCTIVRQGITRSSNQVNSAVIGNLIEEEDLEIIWKLTHEGIELDDNAQTDETITALLKLLKS